MTRILVFSRSPRPGHTKTRLIPAFGPEGAAALHATLIYRTMKVAVEAGCGEVQLWCADRPDDPFIEECQHRFQATLRQQQGDDLGACMFHALNDARLAGHHGLLVAPTVRH